jgi:hypothetical protein
MLKAFSDWGLWRQAAPAFFFPLALLVVSVGHTLLFAVGALVAA